MILESNFTTWEMVLWNVYIIDPSNTKYQYEDDVPDFMEMMVPIFLVIMIFEDIVRYFKGMKLIRLNCCMSSLLLGLLMLIMQFLIKRSLAFGGYSYLYQYRIFTLDWKSTWTWLAAAIGVDFCYYWMHRMSHEINILWGTFGHNVHHSAEDFDLSVAIRQPALQKYATAGFYYPLALLGVPLGAVLAHIQFGLIYQFWIHSEVIPNLGAIEWIFNTASHHRVHHGINVWCLDKNYGSVLIIWDRMFGTFQAEKADEKIIYGIVTQPATFEPIYLQTFLIFDFAKKYMSVDNFSDSLKVILYGPSWKSGTDRLGEPKHPKANSAERKKHDPKLSQFMNFYVLTHFVILFLLYLVFQKFYNTYDLTVSFTYIGFLMTTLYNIGHLLNGNQWISKFELWRCIFAAAFIWKCITTTYASLDLALLTCMGASSLFWIYKLSNE